MWSYQQAKTLKQMWDVTPLSLWQNCKSFSIKLPISPYEIWRITSSILPILTLSVLQSSIHSSCLMKLRSYPYILNQKIIHICIKHTLKIKTGQEEECLWQQYLYCSCATTQAMRNRFIHILILIIFRNKINYFTTKEEGHPGLNSLVKINGREK